MASSVRHDDKVTGRWKVAVAVAAAFFGTGCVADRQGEPSTLDSETASPEPVVTATSGDPATPATPPMEPNEPTTPLEPTDTPTPEETTDTATPEEPTQPQGTVAIGSGEVYEYTDGLQVLVRSAEQFDPSDTAAGLQLEHTGVVVTVTIINGTGSSVDLTLTAVNLRAGAQGEQAESVVDSDNGIDIGFTGQVAPSRRATAKFGFSVAEENLNQIDVEVTPGLDYEGALFTGEVS